jgi:class 3 adenylate cyclase
MVPADALSLIKRFLRLDRNFVVIHRVALVIVDISGYTDFIRFHKATLQHAAETISQLLAAVIDQSSHPLTLNKLEGDAALLYAYLGGDSSRGARDITRQVHKFFKAFHERAHELSGSRGACPCEACQKIRNLRLKAIVHEGEVAFKKFRQFVELEGEAVIVAHRLLKNTVPADEYILMTDMFYSLMEDLPHDQGEVREEHCEGLGSVRVRVFYPA